MLLLGRREEEEAIKIVIAVSRQEVRTVGEGRDYGL